MLVGFKVLHFAVAAIWLTKFAGRVYVEFRRKKRRNGKWRRKRMKIPTAVNWLTFYSYRFCDKVNDTR